MAAMFKAATDTVLTKFQVVQMSFDQVKEYLAGELDIEPLDAKKLKDLEFLEQYHECKFHKNILINFKFVKILSINILVICQRPPSPPGYTMIETGRRYQSSGGVQLDSPFNNGNIDGAHF